MARDQRSRRAAGLNQQTDSRRRFLIPLTPGSHDEAGNRGIGTWGFAIVRLIAGRYNLDISSDLSREAQRLSERGHRMTWPTERTWIDLIEEADSQLAPSFVVRALREARDMRAEPGDPCGCVRDTRDGVSRIIENSHACHCEGRSVRWTPHDDRCILDHVTAENLASVAAAMADTTRARMLVALMDGRAWTARELAQQASVAASTATEHLNRLVGSGLLAERRQGRHRYVQLAGANVAGALEAVAALGHRPPEPIRSLRQASINAALAHARTCYDHLAGALGIGITDGMVERGILTEESLDLTPHGAAWFHDTLHAPYEPARRTATRACLDWTERRVHLGGAVGAHIASVFLERHWVRKSQSSRAIVVTPTGGAALQQLLDIDYDVLRRVNSRTADNI
ncbi:ArsR/SmtB family transcription factor [Microbacterium sp. NPDC055357]